MQNPGNAALWFKGTKLKCINVFCYCEIWYNNELPRVTLRNTSRKKKTKVFSVSYISYNGIIRRLDGFVIIRKSAISGTLGWDPWRSTSAPVSPAFNPSLSHRESLCSVFLPLFLWCKVTLLSVVVLVLDSAACTSRFHVTPVRLGTASLRNHTKQVNLFISSPRTD